ncbi:MAG: TonB-dependent receptor plug domain-containing protein, partial [Phreatobacter sp.]
MPRLAHAQAAPAAEQTVPLDPIVVEGQGEAATGPVRGIIATRSASGSKTDTPLIETPQAITVIGAEQIDLQKPTSVVQATRYAPGIRSESFGADARNDWFIIRGFPQQQTGYFLDGTQLFSTAFATWRLEPWSLERVEVLRGPASTLYGGGDPGGLINAVSKRPPTVFSGAAETGIDSHGNGYGAIDVGGPIGQSGQWFYRLTALGRAGGTQTDYTNNE